MKSRETIIKELEKTGPEQDYLDSITLLEIRDTLRNISGALSTIAEIYQENNEI